MVSIVNFFGTLASATGGLIGVISAFLISKILSREEKFEKLEIERKKTLIKMKAYLRKISSLNIEQILIDLKESNIEKLSNNYDIEDPKNPSDIFNEFFSEYHNMSVILNEIEIIILEKEKEYLDQKHNFIEKDLEEKIFNIESIEEYFIGLNIPEKFKTRIIEKINFLIEKIYCKSISNLIDKDYPSIKSSDDYLKKIHMPIDAEEGIKGNIEKYIEFKLKNIESPMEKMRREASKICSPYKDFLSNFPLPVMNSPFSSITADPYIFSSNNNNYEWNKLNELSEIREDIEDFTEHNKLLYSDLKSFNYDYKNINFFISIILSFFFLGIVYPLSYTKYSSTDTLDYSFNNFFYELFSASGFILLLVTIIFLIFVGKIFQINMKAHFSKDKLNELKSACEILNYCEYFKNYYQNTSENDF